jgi:two-component system cell cycle sensor histidine kinase/response regulator CckA
MRSPAHLLLVEDDADSRDALSRLLIEMGYTVTSATNGLEALQYVESHEPCDAVITDVVMPGMSGVEFARRVRVLRPQLPVMLLTGRPDGIETAVAAGAVPLVKPVTPERLSQVLGDAFANKAGQP